MSGVQGRTTTRTARWWLRVAAGQGRAVDGALVVLAMFVAGWLRWSGLGRQSLWVDEMSSFGLASNGLRQIVPVILASDAHPPLYIFIVHFAHFNLGLGTVDSVRVPSVIAAILTIGVIYLLALILVGRLAAIISTAVAVVSPMLVWYSREGRMYAVTWLLVMLSVLALVEAVRTGHRPWLVLYTIFIALSLYSDISAVMAVVPQVVVVAWFLLKTRGGVRALWLRIGTAYVAGWLLFGPWLALLPRQLPLMHGTFPGFAPGLATGWLLVLNLTGLEAAYASLDSIQVPVVVATLLLLTYAAAVVGAVCCGRDRPLFTAVALSLTVGPAVMCLLLVAAGSPGVLLPRVMGMTAIGLALTLGGTVQLVWRASRPRRFAMAAVPIAALVALAATSISLVNIEAHGTNGQDWRAVATLITERARPGDALIYYPYGLKIMVDAYLPSRSPWVTSGVGIWANPHPVAERYFASWAAGHPRVWFVFYASGGVDMPVHDAWFRASGYRRVAGDPAAGSGVLEYVPEIMTS